MPLSPKVSDTDAAARAVQEHLVAELGPRGRAERLRDLTLVASRLALAGLRTRHPDATETELLLRLATLRLGPDTVRRAYGWSPDDRGA